MATTITELEVGRIVGAPLERKEDAALLTGQAKFVDDMSLPGMVWMAVVRSPYAHARIANVNVDGALAHRGVIAAFSGEELADEWQASLPCGRFRLRSTGPSTSSSSSPASCWFTCCASGWV